MADGVQAAGTALSDAVGDVLQAVKPRLRGVLHEGAFFVSLVSGVVVVLLAGSTRARLATAIYAASVTLLFGTSALYHRRDWSPRARAVMKRLDHSMIFVLIAGTYTPFALLVLHGRAVPVVLSIAWGGAALGIALRMIWLGASRWLVIPLYIGLGWIGVTIFPQLLHRGVLTLLLVLLGGLFYSLGAVVYAAKRPDPSPSTFGYHEVFHALTLAAFVVHYTAVSLVAYRP
ncbi:MAG: hemolysin III family protein [Actinomycetota bacterium]|nr:hemolysin III family protein [Actinomycetota bacterium]